MGSARILATGESGLRGELPGIDVVMAVFFRGADGWRARSRRRDYWLLAARFVRRTPTIAYNVRIGDRVQVLLSPENETLSPGFAATAGGNFH
jgi:hypothetical protein